MKDTDKSNHFCFYFNLMSTIFFTEKPKIFLPIFVLGRSKTFWCGQSESETSSKWFFTSFLRREYEFMIYSCLILHSNFINWVGLGGLTVFILHFNTFKNYSKLNTDLDWNYLVEVPLSTSIKGTHVSCGLSGKSCNLKEFC